MTPRSNEHLRFPRVLLVIFLVVAVLLGLKPWHRGDWALENALAVLGVTLLVVTHRRFPFSRFSYACMFAFLMLHELGAHYTYSEVPYDSWAKSLTGHGIDDWLGLERNHYDRFVHFTWGLLVAYPMREVFVRIAESRGFWGYFLPLQMVMATSLVYELVEWGAAAVVGGDLGQAYLGTQGDEWDAQKDMLLATLGAVIALAVVALVLRKYDRDFNREWAASLRVTQKQPLGEEELARLKETGKAKPRA